MILSNEYPQDFFLVLDNDDFREGRITLNKNDKGYWVEIDIVQKHSRKIFIHVGILDGFSGPQDAVDHGVQKLSHFLKQLT